MNCNQVFKVYRTEDQEPDQWILRQAHGPIRTFDKLPVIQKWIANGKVSENDLISRKGGPWKKIGDIAELNALFKKTPAAAGLPKKEESQHHSTIKSDYPKIKNREPTERHLFFDKPGSGKKPSDKSTLPPPAMPKTNVDYSSDAPTPLATPKDPNASVYADLKGTRFDSGVTRRQGGPVESMGIGIKPAEATSSTAKPTSATTADKLEPDFSQVPAERNSDDRWNPGSDKVGVTEPAWTEKTGGLPMYTDGGESLPPPRRHVGRWVAIGVLGAVVIASLLLFVVLPEAGRGIVSKVDAIVSAPKADRFKKFFDRGQESFLLDSDSAFLQADREFQKVLALDENNPDALAALAELYAVWAQYLRDAKLDAMADAVGGPTDAPNKEVDLLNREFKEKLNEASGWASRAIRARANGRAAFLAQADIYRMKKDLDNAAATLRKAADIQFDTDAEYVSVLIDMEKGDPLPALVKRLSELTADKDKPILRSIYRRARFLAASGEKEKAVAALERLLTLNANHEQAASLLERIKADKPVWISESGAATAADPSKTTKETTKPSISNDKKPASGSTTAAGTGGSGQTKKAQSDEIGYGSVGNMLSKAKRLQKRGKSKEAKALFDRVLEDSPSNVEALSGVGYYYLDKGASGQAIASFGRCLKIRPNFGSALIGLAETYKTMGRNQQALKYYQTYLDTNPAGSQASLAQRNVSLLRTDPVKAAPNESEDIVNEPSPSHPTVDEPTAPAEEATPADSPNGSEAKDEETATPKTPPVPAEKREVIIIERDETPTPESE